MPRRQEKQRQKLTQKLTQLLPKSRSAVLGLHTNACPGALEDSAGSFDSLMLEAYVVALLRVHRTGGGFVIWGRER